MFSMNVTGLIKLSLLLSQRQSALGCPPLFHRAMFDMVHCECNANLCNFRLSSVTLDVANPNAIDILPAVDVEHCECPLGYSGISCEVTLTTCLK